MKKITFILSLFCMILLCTGFVYGMETPQDKDITIINKAEITDIDQLFLRAQHGISDIDVKPFLKKQKAILENQGYSKELPIYVTGQLLKETKKLNGNTERLIAVTTIVPLGSGYQNEEQWDSTLAVKAYSTIYWSTMTDNFGDTGYLLTKVTGGWTISDAQVSLSNRKVEYACNGRSVNRISMVDNQKVTKYPTSNTYSYTTGFTKYVTNWEDVIMCGMNSYVTLTRGGSSWNLRLSNTIFS